MNRGSNCLASMWTWVQHHLFVVANKIDKWGCDTHRDLDGHIFVDAVLVVEINTVDTQPLEAALASRAHVRWIPPDVPLVVCERDAELGGQIHLLPHVALQRLRGALHRTP